MQVHSLNLSIPFLGFNIETFLDSNSMFSLYTHIFQLYAFIYAHYSNK